MIAKKFLSIIIGACCLPYAMAGFFGPLELGMTRQQAEHALSTYEGVKPPGQMTAFGSETASQNFTTTKPFGSGICKLIMKYDEENEGLVSLTLESTEMFPLEKYNSSLRSRYKQMVMMQQDRFGEPLSMRSWPAESALKPGLISFFHVFKMSPDMLAEIGVVRTHSDEFAVVARFSSAKIITTNFPKVTPQVKAEWDRVPEFPELKEADGWILKALTAMVNKKPKDALDYFQKAAELGSPRGYWGLAFLYAGGKGVSSDKTLRDESRETAARMGFALSAVEVDRNFNAAMKKLKVSPAEAKIMLAAMHRAAAENIFSEQYNLGVMYKNGYGVPKNPAKAKEYFQAAAANGDKQAEAALASME